MKTVNIIIGVFLIFTFFGTSCTEESKKEICFIKKKTITIDLKDEPIFNRTPFIAQIVSKCNVDILVANFYDAHYLYFFDLSNGSILNKIEIGQKRLEGFHYVSKDSIFLLYSNQYSDGYIDSTNFVRINSTGNILDYYKVENINIPNSDNEDIDPDKAFYPICRSTSLPATSEYAAIDLVKWYPVDIGTKDFMEQKTPVLSVYNFKEQTLKICNDYWYPGIAKGVYYPGQYHSYSTCLSKNGNPLSRFYFSGTITEWDFESDILYMHELKSQLLDSIYPISEPRTNFTNELEAQYRTISFDPYRNLYFSVLWFNPNIYGFGAYSMIIADENFNYIGEIFNPDIGTWSPLFTEDYIVGFNDNQEGMLQIDFYKISSGYLSQEEYISNIRDSLLLRKENIKKSIPTKEIIDNQGVETDVTLVDCLKGFTEVESTKYALITIYVNQSCPSCVDFVLKALEGNVELFNEYPIYFLLTTNNKEMMNSFLSNYNLKNCKYIVKDENGLVQLSTSIEPSNPRIQLIENDSIIVDTIFKPEIISSSMIPMVFSFFGEEVETNIISE